MGGGKGACFLLHIIKSWNLIGIGMGNQEPRRLKSFYFFSCTFVPFCLC